MFIIYVLYNSLCGRSFMNLGVSLWLGEGRDVVVLVSQQESPLQCSLWLGCYRECLSFMFYIIVSVGDLS